MQPVNQLIEVQENLSSETIRVSALHALAYCPRLFYLEEVEQLYTQDAAVFAGRRLHVDLEKKEDEIWEELFLESEELGIRGRVDALRTLDGETIPYEHKRGLSCRDEKKQPQAWNSDKLQILAYAMLLESTLGITVKEGRIRYHADNTLIHIPLDNLGKQLVFDAIEQARILRKSAYRPPVIENERLCARCSLAPVCLPEEARLAHDKEWQPIRLFPEDDERLVIHILEPGTLVGKTGEQIKINRRNQSVETIPARQIGQLVLHSFSQISTQALHFCASQYIGVHFISGGGRYIGSFDNRQGSIQRRIRQYNALIDPNFCLEMARKLVLCRGQGQRKFLMRAARGNSQVTDILRNAIAKIKIMIKQISKAKSLDSLLGIEGNIAASYFSALPYLIVQDVVKELHFNGRNRRPPKDRFNALLSFGYALVLKDVMNAILNIGLEPALGFYHQPRTQAAPLALDLLEIFRVPLVDVMIIYSINRHQWHPQNDFEVRGQQVWLTDSGKRKFVELYERRKQETWKHPVTGYSLTYRRLFELEVRLLEKEWSGEPGLFGNLILR